MSLTIKKQFCHIHFSFFFVAILFLCEFCWANNSQALYGVKITSGATNYQVFQRNNNDKASFTIEGAAYPYENFIIERRIRCRNKTLKGFNWQKNDLTTAGDWQMKIEDLPTGGPYRIEFRLLNQQGEEVSQTALHNILVGDLWFLGGQSNMDGCGSLADAEHPCEMVNVYTLADEWMVAKDPLTIANEGAYKIYRTSYNSPTKRNPVKHKTRDEMKPRTHGAGLGVSFAKEVYRATGIPVGLIAGSLGGSSMMFWDPKDRSKGEDSLYWCMTKRISDLGGEITGILWWQGESDIYAPQAYKKNFHDFIISIRKDLQRPDLPFYSVQLCHGSPGLTDERMKGWNVLQEAQRQLMKKVDNCGIVSTMDLQLQDAHLITSSYKVVGQRLSKLALREVYGQKQYKQGPRLKKMSFFKSLHGDGIKLTFTGVNGRLIAPTRVSGFTVRKEDKSNEKLIVIRQELDPEGTDSILLHLSFKLASQPELYLWYGYGANPFCNVTDEEGMALAMFGPIAIPYFSSN